MTDQKPEVQKPGVVFQPGTHIKMKRGINALVGAIRPTLGPLSRSVAIEQVLRRNTTPEVLDNGGLIARRIIQLKDRDEDMGAMYLRHVLWEMYERVGDGTATAAVLFQSIFEQGMRYITAGGNAMLLRKHLEAGFRQLDLILAGKTQQIEGKRALQRLAFTICHDEEMSKLLGEVFDIIGEYGRLEIRSSKTTILEREYVEGMYWDGGLVSREMINDMVRFRTVYEDSSIMLCDLDIKEAQELVPLLELAVEKKLPSLVLVAAEVSDRALSILLSNREKVPIAVVKAPSIAADARKDALEDLAILTGAIPLYKAAGDRIENVRAENFGGARRIWANLRNLVIVGGKGDARQLRQHIASLRAAHDNNDDKKARKRLQERIGKLMGGSATLWIGATTPLAIETRKELAERAADAMRGAMRDGVVAGGGIALLECQQDLKEQLAGIEGEVQQVAYKILIRALEQPARALLENAGVDDREVLAQIRMAGKGWGYDINTNQIVDMVDAGICNSASVVRQALFSAIHGAALCLTTDVLVHRRVRPESIAKTG